MPNTTRSDNTDSSRKGFAAMAHTRVEEIARKGGKASAESAGHDGMVERGRSGGHASAKSAGHHGMAERGRKGGHASHTVKVNETVGYD